MKPRLAFVVQRYGLEVNGGAELYCRQVSERLTSYYEVEVITTCAIDHVTWRNEYPPGVQELNGVTVRRFSVDRPRHPRFFYHLSRLTYAWRTKRGFLRHLQPFLEERWMRAQGPYSSTLLRHLSQHQEDYHVLIFFTYLYCTTYYGLPRVASRALLVPTAHDEPPIYLGLFRKIFTAPRGILYNTVEERNFVQELFGNRDLPSEVVGVGIEVPPTTDETLFRKKFALCDPYLLYVGRIEVSKGCAQLFDWFISRRRRLPPEMKLVLVGKAIMPLPTHPDIIPAGFLSEEEKWAAISEAFAVVVPSPYESLSMSLLEAWACGKPALVNGRCAVLKAHCLRSNAGLYYENENEFFACFDFLMNHPEEARQMGLNGQAYVRANYGWEQVKAKYEQAVAWVFKPLSASVHG